MNTWRGVAAAYRGSFALLCEGTIDRLLADTPGGIHLDVGSGTGVLAARAASLGRTVVALDADPQMVALSNASVPGRVVEGSLPDLPFGDDTFDAVTANFVVNHVEDPRAAMREVARVARPGGRVGVTIWTARPAAWSTLVAGAFNRAGVVPVAGDRLSLEMDFDRSVDGLRGLATAAGLRSVTATEVTWNWEISTEALWGGISGGVAGIGQTFLAQDPEVRFSAEREFHKAMEELSEDGMLVLPSTAAYLVAAA